MKLYFLFEDSNSIKWTTSKKTTFVKDFETKTDKVWGGDKAVKTLSKGKRVTLEMRLFDCLSDGWNISKN